MPILMNIMYHIFFSTTLQMPVIRGEAEREQLFKQMQDITELQRCRLLRINAVEDHVHLLFGANPDISLEHYVKRLKADSTQWARQSRIFGDFPGWQKGYAAFSVGLADKKEIIAQIKSQQEYHRTVTYAEEYRQLVTAAGGEFSNEYLE